MKTYIVLIPVKSDSSDPRKVCNHIENTIYPPNNNTLDVATDISNRFDLKGCIEVWDISDFMELVNDQEFHPDSYFMSYVKVQQ